MKDKMGGKLFAAGISLVMAIVLLGTGTFAWFTVNTKAEVEGISISFNSDEAWPFEVSLDYGMAQETATWHKELSILDALGDHLEDYLLRPISTYDLEHWYVADYDAYYNVAGFHEVNLDDVANQRNPFPAGDEWEETNNCLLYVDLWVRTRSKINSYDLRLNNPGYTVDGAIHTDEWETDYGTFVTWKPVWDAEAQEYTKADDAMASIRVGFLTYDASDQPIQALIYEPNADLHQGLGNPPQASEQIYLWDAAEGTELAEYDAADGTMETTMVPKRDTASENGYTLTAQQTLRQGTTHWQADKLNSAVDLGEWGSSYLQDIGRFYDAGGNVVTDSRELPIIASNISRGEVRHIRVFFWLEGQDADCWNMAAGDNLYANLEFGANTVEPAPDEEPIDEP